MKTTIDEYIDVAPVDGILGKYRFMDKDICLGVVGKNAKFVDYMVEAHLKDVQSNAGSEHVYVIVDIRHLLWSNKAFGQMIHRGVFGKVIKACVILAETEYSRRLAEEWIQGYAHSDRLHVEDNLDSAISWMKMKKTKLTRAVVKKAS